MIKILLVLFSIIVLFIVFLAIQIFIKYQKLKRDVSYITKALKRVRYGDINVRVSQLHDKKLETSTNRLIETIYDREMMIKEYQTTMSKKNMSLEEVLKQEKQLQMFKEEFVATLTHDMKVPVIAELNSIEYLLEGRFGELNTKQSEILKLMKSSNNELKDLIDNMLETYKLDKKGLKLNLKEQNFNEFLDNVINEMFPIIFSSGHNISCETKETSNIKLFFDEIQIKRVIKNLILNALSYSPAKSEINIKTYVAIDCIKFVISNKSSYMTDEDLTQIFRKYNSVHSKYKKSGTGLGLYLSRQIALAHNGNIEAKNSRDGIMSFYLTLPLH